MGRLAMIGFLTSVVQEFLTGVLSPSTVTAVAFVTAFVLKGFDFAGVWLRQNIWLFCYLVHPLSLALQRTWANSCKPKGCWSAHQQ